MKRIISMILCVLMVAVMFTGCGQPASETPAGGSPSSGGTPSTGNSGSTGTGTASELQDNPAANGGNVLRYICVAPPGIFNGILYSATYDGYVCQLVFDRLLKYDSETLEFMPQLAESWDLNAEDNSITFNIRKGVKIHNGLGEMTAEDVAFTFSMIAHPNYDGMLYGNFENVVGIEEYRSGKADTIEGITLYGEKPENALPVKYDSSETDPYKIRVDFTQVSLSNLHILASNCSILPRAYYEKPTYEEFKALNLAPVGTGPMIFNQYVIDQYIEMDRNPDYWDGAPKLDKVIYQCVTDDARIATMQSGAADICEVRNVDEDLNQIEPLSFININKVQGTSFAFMRFRFDSPIVQDLKVRQALAYGFDRAGFVESYTGGRSQLTYAPVSRNSIAYPDEELEKYEYNPEKAAALLDEAGWKLGNDGIRYKDGQKMTLSYTGIADNKNDATKTAVMIENYKALGIDFSATFYDWATYMDVARSNDDVSMYGYAWSMSSDPFRNAQLFKTGELNNDGRYSNSEYDELVEKGQMELDEQKAAEYYKKAFKILNDDVPVIFLNDYEIPWVINNRVKNVTIAPFIDWTYDINKVEIIQ